MFVMNSLLGFSLLCIFAMTSFTVEVVADLVSKNYSLFFFFTIWSNMLTWIYFLLKLVYVLHTRRQKNTVLMIEGKEASFLDSSKAGTRYEGFLTYLGFVTTVSMVLVGVVFWTMLSWGCVFSRSFDKP